MLVRRRVPAALHDAGERFMATSRESVRSRAAQRHCRHLENHAPGSPPAAPVSRCHVATRSRKYVFSIAISLCYLCYCSARTHGRDPHLHRRRRHRVARSSCGALEPCAGISLRLDARLCRGRAGEIGREAVRRGFSRPQPGSETNGRRRHRMCAVSQTNKDIAERPIQSTTAALRSPRPRRILTL